MEDIASALSKLCRFGGHCRRFYSIAQHSVQVAELVNKSAPELAFYALLHDSAEAYLLDLPQPIKHAAGMESYRDAEFRLGGVILEAFGITHDPPDVVRWADQTVFATEIRDLMTSWPADLKMPSTPPLAQRIRPWGPQKAEGVFLEMFWKLAALEDPGHSAQLPINR